MKPNMRRENQLTRKYRKNQIERRSGRNRKKVRGGNQTEDRKKHRIASRF